MHRGTIQIVRLQASHKYRTAVRVFSWYVGITLTDPNSLRLSKPLEYETPNPR